MLPQQDKIHERAGSFNATTTFCPARSDGMHT